MGPAPVFPKDAQQAVPPQKLCLLPDPSPGEEQVGFVLQLKIQVGKVVLLGALLLLAVAERAAGQAGGEGGAGFPLVFFFGGGVVGSRGGRAELLLFGQSVRRSNFILSLLLAQ